MINLDQLRIFQAVAQARSFTRAAEAVHLTQPGVSKHIKQMEEYYGMLAVIRISAPAARTGRSAWVSLVLGLSVTGHPEITDYTCG